MKEILPFVKRWKLEISILTEILWSNSEPQSLIPSEKNHATKPFLIKTESKETNIGMMKTELLLENFTRNCKKSVNMKLKSRNYFLQVKMVCLVFTQDLPL